MTWPSTNVPATAPTTHGPVRTQAYQAGGGDYFRSGYYSHGLFTSEAAGTVAMDLNTLYLRPFIIPVRRSFDRIGINVTAAAGAGGVLRMGIFASGADGMANTLLVDGGTVSSTTTGAKEVTIATTVEPGVVWVGVVPQVATCTATRYGQNTNAPWMKGSTSPPSGVSFSGASKLAVSGALATIPPGGVSNVTGEYLMAACLRAA